MTRLFKIIMLMLGVVSIFSSCDVEAPDAPDFMIHTKKVDNDNRGSAWVSLYPTSDGKGNSVQLQKSINDDWEINKGDFTHEGPVVVCTEEDIVISPEHEIVTATARDPFTSKRGFILKCPYGEESSYDTPPHVEYAYIYVYFSHYYTPFPGFVDPVPQYVHYKRFK